MKSTVRVLLLSSAALMATACAKSPEQAAGASTATAPGAVPLDKLSADAGSEAQKFSYAIGVNLGKQLHAVKDEIDVKALEAGILDAADDKTLKLDDKARQEVVRAVASKVQQKQAEERQALGEKNKADGEKFLADNGKREGVKTTASGLQYEVMQEGTGASPTAQDQVKVNYKGTLIDGTVFDSSYDRGEPVTFRLNSVIPGWTEGLQLMKVGGKYKLFIPAELAYGDRGAGDKIGPDATLVFEIELLDIVKPEESTPPAPATKVPTLKK